MSTTDQTSSGEQLDAELEAIRGRLTTVEQKVADLEAAGGGAQGQISEISVKETLPDGTTKTVTFVPAPETASTTTTTSEAEDTGSSS